MEKNGKKGGIEPFTIFIIGLILAIVVGGLLFVFGAGFLGKFSTKMLAAVQEPIQRLIS
jgi:hypothetical protein